mmetsp:Transcript_51031/g.119980  ORF Transcript_51031/g.119980 Transcript_51031/m.119980 type:complete len:236 (+) Transcript_51031:322-1029(+)
MVLGSDADVHWHHHDSSSHLLHHRSCTKRVGWGFGRAFGRAGSNGRESCASHCRGRILAARHTHHVACGDFPSARQLLRAVHVRHPARARVEGAAHRDHLPRRRYLRKRAVGALCPAGALDRLFWRDLRPLRRTGGVHHGDVAAAGRLAEEDAHALLLALLPLHRPLLLLRRRRHVGTSRRLPRRHGHGHGLLCTPVAGGALVESVRGGGRVLHGGPDHLPVRHLHVAQHGPRVL